MDPPWLVADFEGYGGYIIEENDPQNWKPYCEDRQYYLPYDCIYNGSRLIEPYYPILPKYNVKGEFDYERLGLMGSPSEGEETSLVMFGSNTKANGEGRVWAEDDDNAPGTSIRIPKRFNKNALIDLDFSEIEDNTLNDVGPISNIGILIDDYDIDFGGRPLEIYPKKPTIRTKIGKIVKDKPY